MTFFFSKDKDEAAAPKLAEVPVQVLLDASAEEAASLARRLGSLDQELAELLHSFDLPSGLLQKVDLACQEAAGLAAILDIVVKAPTSGHMVDPIILTQAMPLSAQRGRVLSQG